MSDDSLPLSLRYLMLHPSFPPHHGHVVAGEIDLSDFVRSIKKHFQKPTDLTTRQYPAILFATITGECFVAVRGPRNHFSTNFGSELRLCGIHEGRPFAFVAPRFYCRRESGFSENEEWVLFEPVNEPAVLTYQTEDKAVSARFLQLNFMIGDDPDTPPRPLCVQAHGREVCFEAVPQARDILHLLQVGGLASAPTTVVRFPVHDSESETQVTELAWSIAKFCGLVARQFTPPVRLEWIATTDKPVRIEFYSPIRSGFNKRGKHLLVGLDFPTGGLADFFKECFDEFVRLQQVAKWRKVFNYAWAYEDTVFLESRIGTVMAAVELLLRLSLEEADETMRGKLLDDKDPPGIGELISAAKGRLRWDIPKHYTKLERYRQTRNAVVHGRDLPVTIREALDLLQKWGLFLYRRLFIRLGFTRTCLPRRQ